MEDKTGERKKEMNLKFIQNKKKIIVRIWNGCGFFLELVELPSRVGGWGFF